ncbi:MAG: response regulator transcription factor [Sphingobacteriia bacterium]|nr:response regulator transcription factor [Sphingobacteriia bacterium]
MSTTESEKVKVMVVEDDHFMQAILNEYLGTKYAVKVVDNGLDALAILQQGDLPHLVISDLNVPKLNGMELIAQVKASDFFKSIPIMILSGEDSSETRIKCLNAGADDYVVKPFNPKELEARINVILRRLGK